MTWTSPRPTPNTNAFFGGGGVSVRVADMAGLKVRGCIAIAASQGPDVSRCVDMKFE